jgi:hypothetical protein
MTTDRRKSNRESPDRRRETRKDVSLWGYAFAVLGITVLFAAFWAFIYN